MARILGLDLGSHSVKAVLFETTMRGYSTRSVAAVRRRQLAPGADTPADRAETLKAAITELFAQSPLQADQVVVALPGPTLATHVITLPFNDPRRIEQTLPFEIEAQLPFDLSQVVFDYQVARSREKSTDLLVSVLRKEDLTGLLAQLRDVKLDPRIVTHPGITLQNLLPYAAPIPDQPEQAVAIVDLGHERTCVGLGLPGGVVEFARTFSGGGRDLTRALANEVQLSFAEAEQWKEERGAVGTYVAGADAERAAGAFIRGLQPILRELRQTFKAYNAKSRRQIARIYLCGGTARLRGLPEQLANDLAIPVELLPLPQELTAKVPVEEHPQIAQAYALALRGQSSGARAPRFNLRRGDFAFKGDFDYVREKVGRLAAFAATLLVLLIASGVVRNTLLGRREAILDDQLCDSTKRVLGTCEKSYDTALKKLQGGGSPAAAVPRMSAVQLLAEVTNRVPSDVNVTFDQMDVTLERISLRGVTDNTRQIDQVTAELKKYRCFKEVQQRKVEKTRDGQKVSFGLDIQVECPAEEGQT